MCLSCQTATIQLAPADGAASSGSRPAASADARR